jgi:colanic acid/amylovoran biosynthesis glycosyltransferase
MRSGVKDFSNADPRPVAAIFRTPLFNRSETFVQAQASGLTRYRTLVVGLEDKGHAEPALADSLLLPASAWERVRFAWLGRAGAMAARLRPFVPALVHAHFGTDGLRALPLAEALGVPLVTSLHGFDVHRSRSRMLASGRLSWIRYGLFQRRLMEQGALFLAVSDAIRRRAIARGYPPDRTLTHHIGADLGRFRAGGAPEPGLILHVGRLVEKKGARILIDAFATLPPGPVLAIAGDGPLRGALERRAAALGVGERIRFLGALPPAEVAAWMRRAWLLAAPSVTARDGDAEGLPTVVVEAAASGLPVVATDHEGIGEAIVDGEAGFLVPERDAAALAGRLGALLGSAELRGRMGAAARARAETRFDLARQNAILEDHYDAVRQMRPRRIR